MAPRRRSEVSPRARGFHLLPALLSLPSLVFPSRTQPRRASPPPPPASLSLLSSSSSSFAAPAPGSSPVACATGDHLLRHLLLPHPLRPPPPKVPSVVQLWRNLASAFDGQASSLTVRLHDSSQPPVAPLVATCVSAPSSGRDNLMERQPPTTVPMETSRRPRVGVRPELDQIRSDPSGQERKWRWPSGVRQSTGIGRNKWPASD